MNLLSAFVSYLACAVSETSVANDATVVPTTNEVTPVVNNSGWVQWAWTGNTWADLGILIGFAILIQLIVRYGILPIVRAAVRRSSAWWDDVLQDTAVLHRLGWLAPLIVINQAIIIVPALDDNVDLIVKRITAALVAVVTVATISACCRAFNQAYVKALPDISRRRPIKGYLQVVTLISFIIGGIMMIAALLGESPWLLLSGLGAMTAVTMLVFRDTILSFVAGVQLTVNRLVQVGDWIEMPQFSADGDVIDISLNVVLVQNWDKTITAIPAHKFLDNSFKNWRGMSESGGRRIARAVQLDVSSVTFVDEEMRQRLAGLKLLKPYLDERSEQIARWNTEHDIDTAIPGNGRRMTNVGCFRAYVFAYLKSHNEIRQDMTLLVRQQEPGATGLPLQVYAFTGTTAWAEYERIQSDIFDHLYAVLPIFGLRAFQHPTGNDMRSWAAAAAE